MSSELFCSVDLSDDRVRGYVAGLRPFRDGSPRLEVQQRQGKVIGHNYGHGGSGITMSWGSAGEIVAMLQPWLTASTDVAVLGAGIMGLCTASLLLDAGHQVTIVARDFPPHTTSDIAGGLWAPTHVGLGSDPQGKQRHDSILRRSWDTFQTLRGGRWGVFEIPLFESDDRRHPLDPMPEGIGCAPERLLRLPFSGAAPSGQVSRTLLVQTSRFLTTLLDDLRGRGAGLAQRELAGPDDLSDLPQRVLVNCLGLGAREVAEDRSVRPIRGQLVLLEPAPAPFFLDHALGYVISRPDVLILGGTFEEDVEEARPEDQACAAILREHREFFGVSV